MMLNKTHNDVIEKFRRLITGGLKKLTEACELYVNEIDRDGAMRYAFKKANPNIPDVAWKRFEQVGRKTLAAELLMGGCTCVETISRAPVSVQRDIVKQGLPVLLHGEINRIPISDVTSHMARLAISKDGQIRNKQEQEAVLKLRKTDVGLQPSVTQDKSLPDKDWEIRGHRVKFLVPRYYSKSELLRILDEMK